VILPSSKKRKNMSVTTELPINIHITSAANAHFKQLIDQEDVPGMGLRIFLDRPGLANAEVGISFCPPGEQRTQDVALSMNGFQLFVDQKSAEYLKAANIDYQTDKLGGQLAITAPNLRGQAPSEDATLLEKVNYFLEHEVNPQLATHGGQVALVEVTPKNEVILQFGGGCHGCGMVSVTLREGIERNLKEQIPQVSAVIDMTDHSQGDNPYY
jgi:Fe/S biogenesis protein NfuA